MTADRTPPVPLCDILTQYRSLQDEIDAAVLTVLGSGQAILGPEVAAFEREAADYCGAAHAVGCADGTNALLLALAALDLGPGDEVILPPFTFFATVGSILRCGATPVFADVDPLTYNLDPDHVEARITPRTKAVMPVHLFGQCADMDPIWDVADRYGLYVIEDAAQSFGSDYRGRKCGTLGVIGCFSFYPTKNLGTMGDAGMVTTNNDDLARKLAALRVHGSEVKYFHKYLGWNARLDAVQAAILRVKLPHVDGWIDARRTAAARYDHLIEAAGLHGFLHRPNVRPYGRHTFNQYVVRVPAGHRDLLVKHLKHEHVGCEVYYPLSLHQQECLAGLGYGAGDFPVSEEAARSVLALPIFPEITEAQQRRVVDAVAAYARSQVRLAAA
jgi:dTDP-4-amino-4,6-dideoxygalactose transaminase